MTTKLCLIVIMLLALACSAAPRPMETKITGEMRVFMVDKNDALHMVNTLPPDFMMRGVWLSGVEGDMHVVNDQTRERVVLYMTDEMRRVRVAGTEYIVSCFRAMQPSWLDGAQVVLLTPRRWNGAEPRPTLTFTVAPALP